MTSVAHGPYEINVGEGVAPIQMLHGTTTLGFVFQHGIIIAVDSRSTMGPFIASQTVQKVLEVSPYIIATMAGGAADCAYWHRVLQSEVRLYELRNKSHMSVAGASQIFANIMYQYKGRDLSVGTMIAGCDRGVPSLYYCDSDGQRTKGSVFSVGSGSTHAYGVLDSGYRPDLTVEEAIALGRRAIFHATHRDSYSGGIINVYHVHKDGWTKYPPIDCLEFFNFEKNPPLPISKDSLADLAKGPIVPAGTPIPSPAPSAPAPKAEPAPATTTSVSVTGSS
ncbi:putative Proteasome subunit beta type-5 [Paratrimastix pyriformis]|uniref:Proteasome subunit beta n=1 Tax=Paratrimastix pyriformis TaxID=342808 RepID=A0ABQ8URA7_9EUKA|nr:putative Proteasome subunit beta type-5 [Paratrimastix pyriformis]|eukprot:GAFH01002809.1.p1 GENE.GAFH01002809.1~~GAFH01002809.1.p1  ORF type:complete len:289 (-),score=53.67 GAFH01002809.1:202-1041(-)